MLYTVVYLQKIKYRPMDYYLPPQQKDTQVKECDYCKAKGFILLHTEFNGLTLPRFVPCDYCEDGYIDKTDFEIELEIEERRMS